MNSPAPPGFPRRFGQYLLLSPIAQGGMGDVFLASTLGVSGAVRLVVIKTLRQDLATEPGYINRFLDEARIVIQLQHANICQVFEVGAVDGVHFFAMEHIHGTNLRRLLSVLKHNGKALPPALAYFIAAEALEGLDCAHHHKHSLTGQALRVVHRDVSPQNIMISLEGDVKIIDFGLAESELKVEQTETKVVLGKIAYMSPEQARGDALDGASDQYAVGILLYEMLTGQRFYGDRAQPEIWGVAGKQFVPDHMDKLEAQPRAIVRRALQPSPQARYSSCAAMASSIRALLTERFPDVGRGALRVFVRDEAANDVEQSEKTVRALTELALRTVPDLANARADSETGVTVLNARSPFEGRARAAIAGVAAAAVLLVAAVALMLLMRPAQPAVDVARATPAPAPAPAPAPPAPAQPVVEPAKPPAKVEPEVKAHRVVKPPAWVSWSTEQKLHALDKCKEPCTKTIQNVRASGGQVMKPLLDQCLTKCGVK